MCSSKAKASKIIAIRITWCHYKVAHIGGNVTFNKIRSSGFWVIKRNQAVKLVNLRCVTCSWLKVKVRKQFMVDLSPDGPQECSPFTHFGVKMFSPFYYKLEKKHLHCYVALFICLASRVIHTEMANVWTPAPSFWHYAAL